jgi:phosphoserine phosphatase RsbU/P
VTDPIHILVVDDEPDLELLIRQMFRRQIREGALAFSFASDGIEALEYLANDVTTDIVLSDINMPRMDGLSLLGKIRELERPLKVIMVSAYGDMENIRTAMNRGAFDFITKPISFDDLTITIEKTHRDLEVHRKAAMVQRQLTALHRELEIASKIQLSMLPSAFPAFPEQEAFGLYATMIPAQEVGGDLYDCFMLEDGRLGFVVGDVSGKGVGAALFMAITRTILRATALRGLSPAACIRAVNGALFPESMPHMFVTLVYGLLDQETGTVTLCNAGHNRPYVIREDGSVEMVDSPRSIAVCLQPDFAYLDTEVSLLPGESLVVYSDGVTEAADGARERFEEDRLVACLEQAHGESPAEIIRDVLRAIEEFCGPIQPSDDVTLLVLQYAGAEEALTQDATEVEALGSQAVTS